LLNRSVGVIDFEHYPNSRASERTRTPAGPALARGELVANEQAMPTDLKLTMQKFLAIWAHHPRTFNGAERALVEFERSWTIVYEDFRDDAIGSKHWLALLLPTATDVTPSQTVRQCTADG
jgi:hypothetical protein